MPTRPILTALIARIKTSAIASLVILSSLWFRSTALAASFDHPPLYREVRYVMGTLLDISLYHHDAGAARKSLDEAFSVAQRLDNLLSNYKPQSDINRLNQKAGRGRVKVTPELYEFLEAAKSLSQRTGGAFDITVGPLMNLWRDAHHRGEIPSFDSLRAAQARVGYHHLVLHPDLEVELSQEGMEIDTGGIGKGYAVDKILRLFRNYGVTRALINFGHSSIYAMGSPPQAHAWTLLLQFPNQRPLGLLELKDQALSASDTSGRSLEIAGIKYGHIVDPLSGIPITERVQTVVLAPSATEAEVLSKYVTLRGWKSVEKPKTWGKVQIMRIGENRAFHRTDDFPLSPLP